MKATIDENGQLIIQAETPLESYALNRWCDNNFSQRNELAIDTNNILVKTGLNN